MLRRGEVIIHVDHEFGIYYAWAGSGRTQVTVRSTNDNADIDVWNFMDPPTYEQAMKRGPERAAEMEAELAG